MLDRLCPVISKAFWLANNAVFDASNPRNVGLTIISSPAYILALKNAGFSFEETFVEPFAS